MRDMNGFKKIIILLLLVLLTGSGTAFAQEEMPKPVMENVFFNVVWGSAFGATLGVAAAIIAAENKTQPADGRQSAFNGATLGGLIGLGMGLYLVYKGITFDERASGLNLVGQNESAPQPPPPVFLAGLPPFQLESESGQPWKINGFKARVLNMSF